MKRALLLFIPLFLSLLAGEMFAETPVDSISSRSDFPVSEDSVPVYELQEIEIEAPKVVRKADMDVYHPSQSAVSASKNGLQLLLNLQIPSINVNDIMGTVTAAGENIQLRINGREATVEQVRNLLPETVKRVEWMDNPGLRYNGASYVLNFIVSNPTAGGSFMLSAQPAVSVVFGNYNLDLKFNHGRSQWSIGAYGKPTTGIHASRDYKETFTYPDGQSLSRTEISKGGDLANSNGNFSVNYSYTKPDTTVFYVGLNSWNDFKSYVKYRGLMSLSNGEDDIELYNSLGSGGATPSLSVYLEQHLPHNQTIVADARASLYTGYSFTDYLEKYPLQEDYFTDVHTHIRDFNQAYGIEADYIKNWSQSRLTAGASYTANLNRSKYRYLDDAIFHQRQEKLYFFAEYFQKIKRVTFTAGLGAQYTSFVFKETEQGSHSWNLRPQFTMTYSPNRSNQFRLNFTTWQTTPSLSETNITPQQTDGFQWNIGNPELKTYNTYKIDLRYGFNFWRINGNFNISASTSPKAIAPYLFWEGEKLITSYENSLGKQNLSFSMAPQISVIPGWLTISGRVEYLAERTRGTGYKLYNHNWNGSVSGIVEHWGFAFVVQYDKARRSLWGEKISWGEDFSTLALVYTWKDWQFGAGMLMPFGKYDQGSRMLSKWNTNEYHMRVGLREAIILLRYNIQWGRQKNSVRKMVEAEVDVDKSSAKSR